MTAIHDIEAIISRCNVCRIGFVDGGEVYIVPLNFGYQVEGEQVTFTFHGAKAGRKYEALKEKRTVSFELDTETQLIEGPDACDYSFAYESVMGTGEIEMLTAEADRIGALRHLMRHVAGQDFTFEKGVPPAVAIYRLTVATIIGKRNPKPH